MEKCNSADGVIQSARTTGAASSGNGRLMTRSTAAGESINNGGSSSSHNMRFNTQSLPRINHSNGNGHVQQRFLSRTSSLTRDIGQRRMDQKQFVEEDEATTPTGSPPSPPPKPIRSMINLRQFVVKDLPLEVGPLNRVASYHASGSDSGNGSGDSAQSSAANDPSMTDVTPHRPGGVIIKNPRYMTASASLATLKSFSDFDFQEAEDTLLAMEVPAPEQCSKFDLENFQTLLLPAIENKPLDNGALNTLRMMLSETGPRILANHMTRIDIHLLLDCVMTVAEARPCETAADDEANGGEEVTIVTNDSDKHLKCTGIELLTMPHGGQFRLDLIERTECIKLLVSVTILTCSNDDERAETLNKWIQVAIDTKTALGNLFGFCNIMLGLCMPQIQKLETTWHILRQKYTDSAFNFEAKLRPTLKCMNDCTNPQAPNTTLPHLLPYILLKDRTCDEFIGKSFNFAFKLLQKAHDIPCITFFPGVNPSPICNSSLVTSCITPWEQNAADFGLNIMFAHMDAMRQIQKSLPLYHQNAQIVLSDSASRYDELLEDSFR